MNGGLGRGAGDQKYFLSGCCSAKEVDDNLKSGRSDLAFNGARELYVYFVNQRISSVRQFRCI